MTISPLEWYVSLIRMLAPIAAVIVLATVMWYATDDPVSGGVHPAVDDWQIDGRCVWIPYGEADRGVEERG